MITPTRLVAAAAVTALMSGLLMTGVLTTEPSTPAAPTATGAFEPGVITPVEGRMVVHSQTRAGENGTYAGGATTTDEWWETEYRVDDERLSGVAISRHNRNIGATTTAYGGSRAITVRLDNEGGRWVGSGYAFSDPGSGIHYRVHLEGEGGYEGLDAIIALDNRSATGSFEVTGAIISGGLPEMPEPVPVE